MSYKITIDCGTTNTRVYLIDGSGRVRGRTERHVGVRNTSMSGSTELLKTAIREMICELLRQENVAEDAVEVILASGMITSEIGLRELPHLNAPCGIEELASGMERVAGLGLTKSEIPVYFVRGVKNPLREGAADAFGDVEQSDFMRGEETQMAGLLTKEVSLPLTVVVLSSHTKYIFIDPAGRMTGSLTTASGQVRAAILENTFVGKSVAEEADEPCPADYFDERIVELAANAVEQGGLLRSMMYPRFLDVLFDTKWYERKLYYEALIAADDMTAVRELQESDQKKRQFFLIGVRERCRLYEYLLEKRFPGAQIRSLFKKQEIDELGIRGILALWEKYRQEM